MAIAYNKKNTYRTYHACKLNTGIYYKLDAVRWR